MLTTPTQRKKVSSDSLIPPFHDLNFLKFGLCFANMKFNLKWVSGYTGEILHGSNAADFHILKMGQFIKPECTLYTRLLSHFFFHHLCVFTLRF